MDVLVNHCIVSNQTVCFKRHFTGFWDLSSKGQMFVQSWTVWSFDRKHWSIDTPQLSRSSYPLACLTLHFLNTVLVVPIWRRIFLWQNKHFEVWILLWPGEAQCNFSDFPPLDRFTANVLILIFGKAGSEPLDPVYTQRIQPSPHYPPCKGAASLTSCGQTDPRPFQSAGETRFLSGWISFYMGLGYFKT